jgi:hypothetical protein
MSNTKDYSWHPNGSIKHYYWHPRKKIWYSWGQYCEMIEKRTLSKSPEKFDKSLDRLSKELLISEAYRDCCDSDSLRRLRKQSKRFWNHYCQRLNIRERDFAQAVQYELALHNIPSILEYKSKLSRLRIDMYLPTKKIGIELKICSSGINRSATMKQVKKYKKEFPFPVYLVSPLGEIGLSLKDFADQIIKIKKYDEQKSYLTRFYSSFLEFCR